MKTYMVSNKYTGCCYVRLLLPAFQNGFGSNKVSVGAPIDDISKVRTEIEGADVVVFHRPELKEYYDLAKHLKENGKKIVMDNDDTFILNNHPLTKFTPDAEEVELRKRQEAIDKFMKIADLVTASTEFLANEYRKQHDNVVVLPNCVDPFDWEEPKRNKGDKVRIGMVGSVAYEYDYAHLKDKRGCAVSSIWTRG